MGALCFSWNCFGVYLNTLYNSYILVIAAIARRSSMSVNNIDNLEDLDSPSTEGIESGSLAINENENETPRKGLNSNSFL